MRVLLGIVMGVVGSFGLEALEVAHRTDAVMSGYKSSEAQVMMRLKNARGEESLRELKMMHLETTQGDRSLITFLTPKDVQGTQLLTHESLKGQDRQWIYLPALKRAKRISGQNRSGAFMASEFSYEDLASFDYHDYTYEGDAKEIIEDDHHYWQFKRVPKDERSGYDYHVVWVDKERFTVMRIDYFDRKKSLLKRANFKAYQKRKGVWRIGEIEMINYQNKKSTTLTWKTDRVDVGLKAGFFSKQRLGR